MQMCFYLHPQSNRIPSTASNELRSAPPIDEPDNELLNIIHFAVSSQLKVSDVNGPSSLANQTHPLFVGLDAIPIYALVLDEAVTGFFVVSGIPKNRPKISTL